ncbi:MAG: sigma-70 family RNA polymerase sigma factor [Polyangiaceae bacterium]|nr:sigma-70 family RNA polymerase sigma factor [Polyangiaceae bacterium]
MPILDCPPSSRATNPLFAPAPELPAQSWLDDSVDEQKLVEGLIADDPAAWREFTRRYSRLIHRCISRVTGRFAAILGPEDSREIYAFLCVQLLANDKRKLRSFEPGRGTKLGSWIGMLAIHSAYDHLRRVKREPRRGCLAEAEGLASEQLDPFESCAARQLAVKVGDMLAEFSDKDREFITLYYGEGLDPTEVASRMAISIKTVYSKKHKIRARLEAILAERRLAA